MTAVRDIGPRHHRLPPVTADAAARWRRLCATAEVQRCYDVAGEWDYVVVLVANGMAHCGELEDQLFMDDPNIKRFDASRPGWRSRSERGRPGAVPHKRG